MGWAAASGLALAYPIGTAAYGAWAADGGRLSGYGDWAGARRCVGVTLGLCCAFVHRDRCTPTRNWRVELAGTSADCAGQSDVTAHHGADPAPACDVAHGRDCGWRALLAGGEFALAHGAIRAQCFCVVDWLSAAYGGGRAAGIGAIFTAIRQDYQRAFVVCVGVFLAGAAAATVSYGLGVRIAGVGMMLLAVWLLRYDIASRRIKVGGQARYIAFSLLSGYVWLAVGGLLAIRYGGLTAGPMYDAMLHTIFLGFVFTMIFAHAPIIFPAVLRRSFLYTPRLYSHLILLHITLVLRVAGDLFLWTPGRMWGGLLNAVVLLLFLGNTLTSLRK